jgi:hypothetical protein
MPHGVRFGTCTILFHGLHRRSSGRICTDTSSMDREGRRSEAHLRRAMTSVRCARTIRTCARSCATKIGLRTRSWVRSGRRQGVPGWIQAAGVPTARWRQIETDEPSGAVHTAMECARRSTSKASLPTWRPAQQRPRRGAHDHATRLRLARRRESHRAHLPLLLGDPCDAAASRLSRRLSLSAPPGDSELPPEAPVCPSLAERDQAPRADDVKAVRRAPAQRVEAKRRASTASSKARP